MKVKTSLTLSEELLAAIAEREGEGCNRSEFIEHAAWEYLKRKAREEREERDLAIITANIDYLNKEAEDVLRYAAPITFDLDEDIEVAQLNETAEKYSTEIEDILRDVAPRNEPGE